MADPMRHPEVRHVARELHARGFELRELRGRFAAVKNGKIAFAVDDARRLLELTCEL